MPSFLHLCRCMHNMAPAVLRHIMWVTERSVYTALCLWTSSINIHLNSSCYSTHWKSMIMERVSIHGARSPTGHLVLNSSSMINFPFNFQFISICVPYIIALTKWEVSKISLFYLYTKSEACFFSKITMKKIKLQTLLSCSISRRREIKHLGS